MCFYLNVLDIQEYVYELQTCLDSTSFVHTSVSLHLSVEYVLA